MAYPPPPYTSCHDAADLTADRSQCVATLRIRSVRSPHATIESAHWIVYLCIADGISTVHVTYADRMFNALHRGMRSGRANRRRSVVLGADARGPLAAVTKMYTHM